jgi:hypothetical protein
MLDLLRLSNKGWLCSGLILRQCQFVWLFIPPPSEFQSFRTGITRKMYIFIQYQIIKMCLCKKYNIIIFNNIGNTIYIITKTFNVAVNNWQTVIFKIYWCFPRARIFYKNDLFFVHIVCSVFNIVLFFCTYHDLS